MKTECRRDAVKYKPANKNCLCYVQGPVISTPASDNKKVEELEIRLKQERTLKEEIEQKYR